MRLLNKWSGYIESSNESSFSSFYFPDNKFIYS